MYGVEWLIVLGILGLAIGGAGGYLLARGSGDGRRRLEQDLESARRELDDYRGAVVREFSETARKFQTLNDAYTDLHEQLARSSSTLCGDITGPLLEAPAGHQAVIPADVRDQVQSGQLAASTAAAPSMAGSAAEQPAARAAPEPADDGAATAPDPGAAFDANAAADTGARADTATTPDAAARAKAGETPPADATTGHPAQARDASTERPAADGSSDAEPAASDHEPEIRVREPAAAAGADSDIPTLTEEPERRAADTADDPAAPDTATGAEDDHVDAAERAEAQRRAASGH